ncbi:hypothetical protein D515_01642 [Grimontia indica]|uniref:Uncharacterized protein n=1 Tax=Grimontia indica TaxID=1056512 RepID=R1J298_9GAMM|nr:hypothetical protein D515_01642 [Grimontia indica]
MIIPDEPRVAKRWMKRKNVGCVGIFIMLGRSGESNSMSF